MKNIQGKTFLMTGGTGFLGKNMVPFIQQNGGKIVAIGSLPDLSVENHAEYVFKSYTNKFDYIIHGASVTAAGDWPAKHKAEQYDANIRIHTNVLKMWCRYQPQAKMIGMGSSCAYPAAKEFFKEDEFWDGPMHESVELFGFTKKVLVIGIEAYKSQHGLQGTTIIPATLYGPHDHFDPEKSHVVSALLQKFVKAQRQNLPTVEVWGDGSQTREIMYVEDQIRGILTVLDYNGPLINIGSGISTSIKELAELLKEVTEFKGEIFYNTTRFVGNKKKVMDVSLAKSLYGWTTDIQIGDLKEKLKKTVDWYRANQKI